MTRPHAAAAAAETAAPVAPAANRPGRRRDASRDAVILDAALDELAENGYQGMTVAMVAARARAGKATVYRRWPSKADLVLDAVGRLDDGGRHDDQLPDTGSVREDLLAMVHRPTAADEQRRLRIVAGLGALFAHDHALAQAAVAAALEPWVRANRAVIQRAVDRGEVGPQVDVEALAQVIPTMCGYRAAVERRLVDRDFVASLVDGVLVPALRARDDGFRR